MTGGIAGDALTVARLVGRLEDPDGKMGGDSVGRVLLELIPLELIPLEL